MSNLAIESVQYMLDPMSGTNAGIRATIDGQEMSVPLDPSNRHYLEIMRQVEAGDLVVDDAD